MATDFKDIDIVRGILPERYSKKVTEQVLEMINTMGNSIDMDEESLQEIFIQGIPALSKVSGTRRVTIKDYINAVKFVAAKIKTEDNIEAYKLVFPERATNLIKEGRLSTLKSSVTIFNNSPLVTAIEADMMVATHIRYAGMRHKAIQHQYNLMNGTASPYKQPVYKKDDKGKVVKDKYGRPIQAKDDKGNPIFEMIYPKVSPTVQQLAAKTILEITAIPVDMNINVKHSVSDEVISATRDTNEKLHELAKAMRDNLAKGKDIKDIQVIGHVVSSTSSKKDNNIDEILDIDIKGDNDDD